jgi:hypothetical protein
VLSAIIDPTPLAALMPIRRLAFLVLSCTAIACTVSPIPASSPVPSGGEAGAEEAQVRQVIDRHFERLVAGQPIAPAVEVSTLDVTGDVAAAKVVETYPSEVRVEYVNLARGGGEWRIVNRVSTHWAR